MLNQIFAKPLQSIILINIYVGVFLVAKQINFFAEAKIRMIF